MSADDLDHRIRALVASAVADTPPAPPPPAVGSPAVVPFRTSSARRPGWVWASAAVATAAAVVAAVVLIGTDDEPGTLVPATGPETTLTTTTEATLGWPGELTVIIASERGIERAAPEDGELAVTRLAQPLQGDVAFELADGTVVSAQGLMDVGLDGQALYAGEWAGFSAVYQYPLGGARPENPLLIPFDGEPTRLTHGLDIVVGEGTLFAGGRTPILFTQAGVLDLSPFTEAGITPPLASNGEDPRLFSVSASGSTIGWLQGDDFVLSTGSRYTVPDGSKIWEVDLTDTFVAFTRGEGPGTILDLRDGSTYDAPAAGRLTISLATTATTPTTTLPETTVPETAPTTTANPIWGRGWSVVRAGADGVVVQTDGGEDVVWTTEPMAAAVMAPDGSLIVQRHSGYPGIDPFDMSATVPLRIASPGAEPVDLFEALMPAADPLAAWYTVHDAATVDGRPLLLMERQFDQANGFESPAGALFTLDLATGEMTTVVDQFAGWEQGSSRLHLAETGLIVGEFFDSATGAFFAVHVLDEIVAPTAADFGLEPYYGDCSECPRRYTVSRDGQTIAWLDGTELVVHSATGSEELRYDLGDAAVGVADMAIGPGHVLLSYSYSWQEDVDPPVVVLYTTGQQTTLAGRTATLATR